MVDDAVVHLRDVRDRPVWQAMPDTVRNALRAPLPQRPAPLAEVWRDLRANLMPYPMGNIHPRFWVWYMGAGNFTGALGDFLAAIQGSNLGGGNTCRRADGPAGRRLVPGDDGLSRRRHGHAGRWRLDGQPHRADRGAQRHGRASTCASTAWRQSRSPLRFYGSDQVHSCHRKAMECWAWATVRCVRIPTDDCLRIDIGALAAAIAEDRAAGLKPACVIATAGTTNTGAIDDLAAIADLCRREGLWFHVDGCIGALIAIAPRHKPPRRRHRARRLAGARPAQMAARALRGRLRAGPGCGGASRRVRGDPEYLEGKAARPRVGGLAARLRPADQPRLPGAQGLDAAEGAWRRQVRPPDRPEHRPGALSGRA